MSLDDIEISSDISTTFKKQALGILSEIYFFFYL